MLSEEADLEDIEALLYAQVYYGKSNEAEVIEGQQSGINEAVQVESEHIERTGGPRKSFPQKKRYFENSIIENNVQAIENEGPSITTTKDPITEIDQSSAEKPNDQPITPSERTQNTTLLQTTNQNKTSNLPIIEIVSTSSGQYQSSDNSHNIQPHFLNNITINQYIYPPNFLSRLNRYRGSIHWSKKCKSDLSKLKKGVLSEEVFFNNLRKRFYAQNRHQKNQNQIRKIVEQRQRNLSESEVICLSDTDEDDDVVAVTLVNKKTPRIKELVEYTMPPATQNDYLKESSDEDEIIYIAPPPVPIVHVDSDSEEDTKQETDKSAELIPETVSETHIDPEDASNDFLASESQPGTSAENFNFALHGADFDSTNFARPANPTDHFETESSTSTSDFNKDSSREFQNSVKTIVFNEVEFPQGDIFEESNLETFGKLITPKRGTNVSNNQDKSEDTSKTNEPVTRKRAIPRTASESSSESDFETTITHRNLPHLTPMICAESSPVKHKKDQKKVLEPAAKKSKNLDFDEVKKTSKKKKKRVKSVQVSEAMDVEGEAVVKGASGGENSEETPRKKLKKKKKKRGYSGSKSGEEMEVEEASNPDDALHNIDRRQFLAEESVPLTSNMSETLNTNWTLTLTPNAKKNKYKQVSPGSYSEYQNIEEHLASSNEVIGGLFFNDFDESETPTKKMKKQKPKNVDSSCKEEVKKKPKRNRGDPYLNFILSLNKDYPIPNQNKSSPKAAKFKQASTSNKTNLKGEKGSVKKEFQAFDQKKSSTKDATTSSKGGEVKIKKDFQTSNKNKSTLKGASIDQGSTSKCGDEEITVEDIQATSQNKSLTNNTKVNEVSTSSKGEDVGPKEESKRKTSQSKDASMDQTSTSSKSSFKAGDEKHTDDYPTSSTGEEVGTKEDLQASKKMKLASKDDNVGQTYTFSKISFKADGDEEPTSSKVEQVGTKEGLQVSKKKKFAIKDASKDQTSSSSRSSFKADDEKHTEEYPTSSTGEEVGAKEGLEASKKKKLASKNESVNQTSTSSKSSSKADEKLREEDPTSSTGEEVGTKEGHQASKKKKFASKDESMDQTSTSSKNSSKDDDEKRHKEDPSSKGEVGTKDGLQASKKKKFTSKVANIDQPSTFSKSSSKAYDEQNTIDDLQAASKKKSLARVVNVDEASTSNKAKEVGSKEDIQASRKKKSSIKESNMIEEITAGKTSSKSDEINSKEHFSSSKKKKYSTKGANADDATSSSKSNSKGKEDFSASRKNKSLTKDANVDEVTSSCQTNSKNPDADTQEDLLSPDQNKSSRKDNTVELNNSQTSSEDELIIIEEPVIVYDLEDEVYTIGSSDDEDFRTFEDVGHALQLANTSLMGENADLEVDFSNFDVENIQEKMSDDPDKWKVLSTDRYNISIGKKGPRCNRCRQFGHMAVKCINKPMLPNCTLCGNQGHLEPRCPNKVCFSCGNPGSYSTVFCWKCANQRKGICSLCFIPGHRAENCPDLWRRYHLTTENGPIITPKKELVIRPKNQQWCSGCANQGHLEFECRSYKWHREYPATSHKIFKYIDIYKSDKRNDRHSTKKPEETIVREAEPIDKPNQDRAVESEELGTKEDKGPNQGGNSEASAMITEPMQAPESQNFPTQPQNNLNKLFQSQIRPQSPSIQPQSFHDNPRKINPISVANQHSFPRDNRLVIPNSPNTTVLNPFSVFSTPLVRPNQLFSLVSNQILANQLCNLRNAVDGPNVSYDSRNVPSLLDTQIFPPSPGYNGRNYYNQNAQTPRNSNRHFDKPSTSYPRHEYDSYSHPNNLYSSKPQRVPDRSVGHNVVDQVVSQKFLTSSVQELQDFLSNELEKLGKLGTDVKTYKKKLNTIENLKKIEIKTAGAKKQIYFLYKQINMFVFGMHKMDSGKRHLDYMQSFLYRSCGLKGKRRSLLESYGYIFGGEHPHVNYRSMLNTLSGSRMQRNFMS